MNKNLLLLGKNNFLTNDIVTKFKQNNINYFHCLAYIYIFHSANKPVITATFIFLPH